MADRTLIVAGLGNPGKEYARTRHNAGFLALDELLAHFGAADNQEKWEARFARVRARTASGESLDVVLLRPLTFMNLSGKSVCPAAKFYKIVPEDLLVLHDEIDIPFGDLRLKKGGGHAGHNGIRDIIERCGSREFYRLRIGVGRPEKGQAADHVLSRFRPDEEAAAAELVKKAKDWAIEWIAGTRR